MENEFNLEIKDTEIISSANINIGQINVVDGVNSSGKTLVSKLLYCYLKSKDRKSLEELLENEGLKDINLDNIKFNLENKFSNIVYLESISILDLFNSQILSLDHIQSLKQYLNAEKKPLKSDIISKINEIIEEDSNPSAGVKTFDVIKTLIKNASLKENTFLIIDEPESSLHPQWRIRFAEILVLLSKDLNITLYMNSYCPIFIESIYLYSRYYDLSEYTNVYITRKNENDKFDFTKIGEDNIGEIYEDLTKPYDELDRVKAEILFKE